MKKFNMCIFNQMKTLWMKTLLRQTFLRMIST